jgi:hypothetical protein
MKRDVTWADAEWVEVSNPGTGYQDYYEFSGTNFSSFPDTGITAPQLGTTNGIELYSAGSRLMMAVIRNGFLWTCQTVGMSGTNGIYVGDASGTNVDRSGELGRFLAEGEGADRDYVPEFTFPTE